MNMASEGRAAARAMGAAFAAFFGAHNGRDEHCLGAGVDKRWRDPFDYNRRAAEPPSRRAAEPPSRRAASSASAWHSGLREPATGRRSNTRRRASFFRSHTLASARRFRRGLLSALLGLPLLFGFAASAQAQSTPGLEFSTTHLTWNESQGCGEFEYYGPDGNKITGNTAQQRRRNALAASLPVVGNQLSARGASMELPASAPGPTYRVKLKTKPKVR